MNQAKENKLPNPRDTASVLSKVFFSWLIPLLRTGYRKPLDVEDLYKVQQQDESQRLGDLVERKWKEELVQSKTKGTEPSYVRALARSFGFNYALVGILACIEECVLRIGQPLCLGGLIQYFNGDHSDTAGWLFATGIMMGSLLYIFTHHPFFWGVQHTGMQIRISSCSLLYRKSLRLSKAALGKTTIGQMVNLLSNDVNRFDTSVIFLHYLWIGPLQLLISTIILWFHIGPSCLAGIVLLILFVPLQSWMGKVFSKLRLKTALRTDERVRIMNEIVSAMRVIKMYTWEKPFTMLIEEARKKEVDVIMKTNYYRAVNMSLFFTSSKVIVFLALLTYILTGNTLTAEKVFVTSALINNIRLAMTLFFPFAIALGSETLVSCKRLQEFLMMEEREDSSRVQHSNLRPKPKDCSVTLSQVTAKWSEATEENTLNNISLTVKAGELLAVIGPVGSGKGSLLSAILGELPATSGSISVRGKIAYCSQEPWVFSGTVKQNILFGQPYDEKRYREVIRVCALEKDLIQLPMGDATMVGERGVSLSGGQKARVNLARAIYFDADIYLMDDPLSAVDAHVGRHLFDECITLHLKNKVRILVTHQLQYLSSASQILILKEGNMEAIGSYKDLVNSGINIASLMSDGDEDQKDSIDIQDKQIEIIKGSGNIEDRTPLLHETVRNLRKGNLNISALNCGDKLERRGSNVSLIEMSKSTISVDEAGVGNILTISAAGFAGSKLSIGDPEASPATPMKTRKQKRSNLRLHNIDEEKSQPLLEDPDIKTPVSEGKDITGHPKELRAVGTVSGQVYLEYFLAGGGYILMMVLFSTNVITQILFSGSDYWLSYWTNGEELRGQLRLDSMQSSVNFSSADNDSSIIYFEPPVPEGYLDTYTNVYIYSAITGSLFLLSLGRTILFFVMCMTASRVLHNRMFSAVIRTPIKFFDTHPVGQTLNRFTKDIGQVDELLPATVFDVLTILLNFLGILVVIASINFWVLIPTVLLGIIFVFLRGFYLRTARDIKRLEGITRSPVFSHLSASLQGLTTIRAFQAQEVFNMEFDNHQDLHSSAWFLFLCTTRWFGICLDWISCIYIAIVTYSFMGLTKTLGGEVGLAISSAMMLSGMFQWGVRQSAEVENQMTSVERVLEYSRLESEAELESKKDVAPKSDWPSNGVVSFEDVSLHYDKADPPVLKNLNFCIKGGEKIGIVGRTGAGKSSMLTCLFRLTEPNGVIRVDDLDIQTLGLHDVRGNISIIPQDPTLFTGTLRKNLDPFSDYCDDKLWQALEEVQLKDAISDLAGGLEAAMSEGGSNLSVGQRQLVCLARAILRHNKILVLDEATANVDPITDRLIQQTIRNKFRECTVLTIAHRLHTIMDSDRVMVLEAGRIVEYEDPHILLSNPKSVFSQLVQQTGKTSAAQLQKLAKKAHCQKYKIEMESSEESAVVGTEESGEELQEDVLKISDNAAEAYEQQNNIKIDEQQGEENTEKEVVVAEERVVVSDKAQRNEESNSSSVTIELPEDTNENIDLESTRC